VICAAVPYAYGEIQTEVVFDRKNDRYLLVNVGWRMPAARCANAEFTAVLFTSTLSTTNSGFSGMVLNTVLPKI
jgi:hypothetical protein